MTYKKRRPVYGNWIPMRVPVLLWILSFIFSVMLIFSVFGGWSGFARWLSFVLALLSVVSASYLTLLRYGFSYEGGGVMDRVHKFVARRLPWNGRGRILDVGCGSGALSIMLAKNYPSSRVIGVDCWGSCWDCEQEQCIMNAAAEGVKNVTFVLGEAGKLRFGDGEFDAVVSNFVFDEVRGEPDKRKLVRESLRVLKKGGAFVFHDRMEGRRSYGDIAQFIEELKAEGIDEVHYEAHTERLPFIPKYIRGPMCLRNLGILWGIK